MKYLNLSQNKVAQVCDCHYDLVKDYKWHFHPDGRSGYAQHSINYIRNGRRACRVLKMYRVISGAIVGDIVDHRDLDKLNNQCYNLRISKTCNGNVQNISTPKHNTSGYKGVQWRKDRQRWIAVIRVNNHLIRVGSFKDIHQAARAYNKAALKYHGEYARLNEVGDEKS